MCILIYYPSGKLPNPDHLRNSCENNPHGFGWAIIAGNDILTGHSMDPEEAMQEFIAARDEFRDGDALFHARITTHGTTTLDNCHPFFVNGRRDMVLAHNGMMPCQPKPGDLRSDTRIFAEDVLMRDFRRLDKEKTIKRLSSWVGYSKVLILSTNPTYSKSVYLINSGMGHWVAGVWYSNDSYKADPWAGCYTWDKWPTNIGGKYDAILDDETAWECGNAGCHQSMDDCQCHTPLFRVRSIEDVFANDRWVPGHKETDDIDTWWCRMCNRIGWISGFTLRCAHCHGMYCCDQPSDSCQCWPTGQEGYDQRIDFVDEMKEQLRPRPLALTAGGDIVDGDDL